MHLKVICMGTLELAGFTPLHDNCSLGTVALTCFFFFWKEDEGEQA